MSFDKGQGTRLCPAIASHPALPQNFGLQRASGATVSPIRDTSQTTQTGVSRGAEMADAAVALCHGGIPTFRFGVAADQGEKAVCPTFPFPLPNVSFWLQTAFKVLCFYNPGTPSICSFLGQHQVSGSKLTEY